MLLRTHYMFTASIVSMILVVLHVDSINSFLIALYLSFLGNTIIDQLGHEMKMTRSGAIPVRTPLTHTLPRSVIWGFIPAIPLFIFYHVLSTAIAIGISGLIVGPSHMGLDVMTENGIYVKRNSVWVRFAIAHFRYNNPAINGVMMMIGVLLLFSSLSFHY